MHRIALVLLVALGTLSATAAATDEVARHMYVSLPMHGPWAAESRSMVDAIRLALEETPRPPQGPVVRWRLLDSSTAAAGGWDPAQVAANAREAAQDGEAIAYIGEFNSGASAISGPILNEAGILQISPSNTYTGLTRREGARAGEPEKYRPTGRLTFGRLAPADHLQAAAMAGATAEAGVRRLFLVHDGEHYGRSMVKMLARRARARVVGRAAWPGRIARRVRRARPDAIAFGGITQNRAARLWRLLHRAAPRARLYGFDGVADERFTRAIPRSTRRLTLITLHARPDFALPPAGRAFAERFRARHGTPPRPYAAAAYEAARTVLDAVYSRGEFTRQGVADAFFATRDRDSVLGRYSIDANGDLTTAEFGLYGVSRRGRLVFDRSVSAP